MHFVTPLIICQAEHIDDGDVAVESISQVEEVTQLHEPKMFGVAFYNNDYTCAKFVRDIVMTTFNVNEQVAYNFMLHVHNHGKGVIGRFSKDVAEMKSDTVNNQAKERGYPLTTHIEELP